MKKWQLMALGFVMAAAILWISVFAGAFVNRREQQALLDAQRQSEAARPQYGQDGLPEGGQLAAQAKLVTDSHVIFEDRVLARYHFSQDQLDFTAAALSDALAWVPEDVKAYVMLVPTRISYEQKYQSYSDDAFALIEALYQGLPQGTVTVDAAAELLEHRDEYVFFRTDDVWTALGAYYGARAFCVQAGRQLPDIGSYVHAVMHNYLGAMSYVEQAQSLAQYPDYVDYYLQKDAVNTQRVTTRISDGTYGAHTSPTVSVARLGYDIFLGSRISHSIIEGDVKNGKILMVVADDFGKALAPWLTACYERIVYINPVRFDGDSQDFWALFDQYDVDELLVLESVASFGESIFNIRLRELMVSDTGEGRQ